MALTSLHVLDVCCGQAGQKNPWGIYAGTKSCKFLTHEMIGKEYKPLCIKLAPALVDKKRKITPDFDKLPNNCPGYKYLKYIDQGYHLP